MHPRKARRCRSVHHQVLIIALLPALVVTAIVAIVMYRGTLVQGKQTLLRQGAMLAEQLATKLEYTLSTGAVEQLPDILAATLDPTRHVLGTDIGQVTVFDKDDQVLYHTTFLASSQGPASAPAAPARSAPATAATQIFTAAIYLTPLGLELYPGQQPTKRYLGKVRLEMLTTTVEAELSRRFLRDVAFVLGTFCGALVLAHWTGRRFSRSLQEAAGAISQIKGGNLRIHLPQTETNEIGTLQEGVNLLADTLATAREKLERELARVRNEYHQVLEDLRLQTQEAHQANQAKSLFLAKISHEMRTPLYSIQGLTERRLKVGQRADERSDLQGIQTAAHKLHLIISDILDYTQLESGRYVSSLTMIDLWAALETEIETVGPLASRQPLYLDVIVEDAVPSVVMGDAKAFRAILANLIANAVKFTEHGGVIIRLGVASRQDATVQIRVMVQDTGPGHSRRPPHDHFYAF